MNELNNSFIVNNYYNELSGQKLETGVVVSFRVFGRVRPRMDTYKCVIDDIAFTNSVWILAHDNKARENLFQYIARHPVSLKKITYEPQKGEVLYHTKYTVNRSDKSGITSEVFIKNADNKFKIFCVVDGSFIS